MGFTIDYDFGIFSGLILAGVIIAAGIVLYWVATLVRGANQVIHDEEQDAREHRLPRSED